MNIDEVINGWTFEETIKTAKSLMEAETNMFKWDVIRHLRNFAEAYREQLKEYQQLEEQGRLIKLPCKVGDTVYLIDRDENNKFKVYEGKWKRVSLVQTSKDGSFNLCGEISYDIYDCFYDDGRTMKHEMYVGQESTEIGKVVFLTKPEADAKLKELRGGENGEIS